MDEGTDFEEKKKGAWVAQLLKRLTLDLGSGHDLTVGEFKPHVGSALRRRSLLGILSLSLSLSLCPSPTLACSVSVSQK